MPQQQKCLRIMGFGACMISGYPFNSGGFVELAVKEIQARTALDVQMKVLSLSGFPAQRAAKYLKRQVIPYSPDYAVIQFGSTDAACVLRKRQKTSISGQKDYKSASHLSILRWKLRSIAADILKPEANSALECYLPAMEDIIAGCIDARIKPVVLSPFIFGANYSMRNAAHYAELLRHMLSKFPEARYVDCIRVLSQVPRSKALLADGFHLSRFGHRLVGLALAGAIIRDLQNTHPPFLFSAPQA
jgi:lysophospholipase L1-like esterase